MYPSLEKSTTGIAITKGYTHATSLYASDSSVSTSAASTPSMMSLADGAGIAYDIVGHILEEVILELVSKELNHFGVIVDLFRQIGGHTGYLILKRQK